MGMSQIGWLRGLQMLMRMTTGSPVSVKAEHQSGQYFHWRSLGWRPHDRCHVSHGKVRGSRSQAGFDGGPFDRPSVRGILARKTVQGLTPICRWSIGEEPLQSEVAKKYPSVAMVEHNPWGPRSRMDWFMNHWIPKDTGESRERGHPTHTLADDACRAPKGCAQRLDGIPDTRRVFRRHAANAHRHCRVRS